MSLSVKRIEKLPKDRICQFCKYWQAVEKSPRPWGHCSNQEVIKRVDVDQNIKDFSPDFDFGCRFWEE